MNIARLCHTIEGHEMAARINVASSLRLAVGLIRTDPIVSNLAKELTNPGVPEYLLQRFLDLTEQATDVRYEHPNDVALMIYTWVLYRHNPLLGSIASAAISQTPNLWWASKIATQIMEHRLEQNEMGGTVSTPVPASTRSGDRLTATNARFPFPSRVRFVGKSVTPTTPHHSHSETTVLFSGQPQLFAPRVGTYSLSSENVDTADLEWTRA